MDTMRNKIGRKLKLLRVNLNLTQEEFAEKIDLTARSVSCLEKNGYFKYDTLVKICETFNVPAYYFFDFRTVDQTKSDKEKISEINSILCELDSKKIDTVYKMIFGLKE